MQRLSGELGDDPLGAARPVTEQHHVVGQVQGNHTSRASAPDRLQGIGQLGEQQGQGDDATDDHVQADDPAPRRDREDVAVPDRR